MRLTDPNRENAKWLDQSRESGEMEDDMEIPVVPLSKSRVDEAARLLAGYLTDDAQAADPERLAQCRRHLDAMLAAPELVAVYLAGDPRDPDGFMVATWSFTTSAGRPVLRVEALYTRPDRRRRGVGHALLAQAAALGRSRGAHRLQLDTDDDNHAAGALYTAAGFHALDGKTPWIRPL